LILALSCLAIIVLVDNNTDIGFWMLACCKNMFDVSMEKECKVCILSPFERSRHKGWRSNC